MNFIYSIINSKTILAVSIFLLEVAVWLNNKPCLLFLQTPQMIDAFRGIIRTEKTFILFYQTLSKLAIDTNYIKIEWKVMFLLNP